MNKTKPSAISVRKWASPKLLLSISQVYLYYKILQHLEQCIFLFIPSYFIRVYLVGFNDWNNILRHIDNLKMHKVLEKWLDVNKLIEIMVLVLIWEWWYLLAEINQNKKGVTIYQNMFIEMGQQFGFEPLLI